MSDVTFSVRQATLDDLATVSDILTEAVVWLEQKNMVLWQQEHIARSGIRQDIELGLFYIAFCEGIAAGVVKFQTEDLVFWPDISQSESAFLHRLAVRRKFAGGLISTMLLEWAVARTRELGKHFLRLDCVADRPRLRSIYEKFGFRHHSDRQVGAYFVARYEYKIMDKNQSIRRRSSTQVASPLENRELQPELAIASKIEIVNVSCKHPFGKFPTLDLDGELLYETAVITQYLGSEKERRYSPTWE